MKGCLMGIVSGWVAKDVRLPQASLAVVVERQGVCLEWYPLSFRGRNTATNWAEG